MPHNQDGGHLRSSCGHFVHAAGIVKAWPLPIWHPSTPDFLGPRPGNAAQPMLTATSF
jgi:hypothetical protein